MKSFNGVFNTPKKKKYCWKTPPQPIPHTDPYANVCRIFPAYVAENHEFFEMFTKSKIKVSDVPGYLLRIKQKIACLKADSLL